MRKRAELPSPLPLAGEGGRAGDGTGGFSGGDGGAGAGEEVEDEEAEEVNFEERLEALAQRGEFSTIKALLSEQQARHAAASNRQDGAAGGV